MEDNLNSGNFNTQENPVDPAILAQNDETGLNQQRAAHPDEFPPEPKTETVDVPTVPVEPTPEVKDTNVVSSISERLGQRSETQVEKPDDAPQAKDSAPFDVTKLTPEQLQVLKQMLNITPDRINQPKKNPKATLRAMTMNHVQKFVIDLKDAYIGLEFNSELQKDVEVHRMPVLFYGDSDFTDVIWKDFMNADRVTVEILNQREVKRERPEGQVFSRELGRVVEAVVMEVDNFVTVKMPDGNTVEIKSRAANA